MKDQKIAIEFDGLKREMGFPFGICCSREVLEHLIRELEQHLSSTEWIYGWTVIRAPYHGTPNQKPIGWHESQAEK